MQETVHCLYGSVKHEAALKVQPGSSQWFHLAASCRKTVGQIHRHLKLLCFSSFIMSSCPYLLVSHVGEMSIQLSSIPRQHGKDN